MTKAISEGIELKYDKKHNSHLWILICVCVVNLTLLLGIWWKYYGNVEEKIVATEYILTFIPLNEINKNKKIAQYIKENILGKK